MLSDALSDFFRAGHKGEFTYDRADSARKGRSFKDSIVPESLEFEPGYLKIGEYLLDSVLASTMLSNSKFIVMLNQATSDRRKLGGLLGISPEQMGYITNADEGCGLLRYSSALVPFVNRFPRDR